MPDSLNDMLVRRTMLKWGQMEKDVGNWKDLWDDIGINILTKDFNKVTGSLTKGDKRVGHLYDLTARKMNSKLARGLGSLLTNPTIKFFELTTGDPEQDKNDNVKRWLQKQEEKLRIVLNSSNLQTELEPLYEDLCGYGTAVLRQEEDEETDVRFWSKPIFKHRIKENSKGIVDTVYREFRLNMRQIQQEYGKDSVPEDLKTSYKNAPDREFTIVHGVEPWEDVFGKPSSRFKFANIHMIQELNLIVNLPKKGKPDGYFEWPYATPRFSKTSDEEYGRSPSMDILPDHKSINLTKKLLLQSAQLTLAPPLQATDNGLLRKVRLKPYGMTYRRPGSDKIEPLFPGSQVNLGVEVLELLRQDLRDGYYLPELELVEKDRMTATEVVARRDENLRGFGSLLARITSELLEPIVNRTFGILQRKGKIDDLPEELQDKKKVQVRFTSLIAKAQQAVEAENFNRAIQSSATVFELFPEAKDNINPDKVIRKNFNIFGADFELLNTPTEVKNVREARAEQEKEQERQERENVEADTAQKLKQSTVG